MGTNYDTSDGTNDCIAYINKLTNMANRNSLGTLFISAASAGYANTNWYFDYADGPPTYLVGLACAIEAEDGVRSIEPTASIIGTTGTNSGGIPNYTTLATNVAGYFTGGWDGGTGDGSIFVDTNIAFFGNSGWFIMSTVDSYNGRRTTFQAGFLTWFASNAFGGVNYANTTVGGITHVDEPSASADDDYDYFGNWASGKCFAICAWAGQIGTYGPGYSDQWFQAVGDPFVRR
jgi:hypothetical protein